MIYEWYHGGAVVGEQSILQLTDVQAADAGDYHVVVSNIAGEVTSDTVTLELLLPPEITQLQYWIVGELNQLSATAVVVGDEEETKTYNWSADVVLEEGDTVELTVTAVSSESFSFEWYHGEELIEGGTESTLRLTDVEDADSGDYYVVVSNQLGTEISENITLTVMPPPTITELTESISVVEGESVELSVKQEGLVEIEPGVPVVKAPDDLTTGLVAYYPFNGNANDESGNGNDGSVNGATLTPDRNDADSNAYKFDGDNDFITLSNPNAFKLKTHTISIWVRFITLGNSRISILGSEPGIPGEGWKSDGFALGSGSDGHLYYKINSGSKQENHGGIYWWAKTASNAIKPSTWYQLVTSYDGNVQKIYLNGELIKTVVADLTITFGNTPVIIGDTYCCKDWIADFEGDLDDLRFYDRVLSEAEVAKLHDLEKPETVGPFTEVSANVGLQTGGTGGAWADFDGDGDPDLFVGEDRADPVNFPGRLFINEGVNGFRQHNQTLGKVAKGTWADFDEDGDPDLHATWNSDEPGKLFVNENGGLIDQASSKGSRDGGESSSWGDYDGDGDPDLLVTRTAGAPTSDRVYRNDGGTFVEKRSSIGLSYSTFGRRSGWVDYDGDGDLDLHVLAGHRTDQFYRNEGGAFK
ncbi:MAG: FG-GAP-like repeat-containing protein, partial [Candidatus Poribacteria bacterium]|nr:FG-GAP-like repeat-containing protein [Candidatus Poribacteria bacterium]